MKVYLVEADLDHFQYMEPTDRETALTEAMLFDGSEKASAWSPPEVYLPEPKLKRGAFIGFLLGSVVLRPDAVDRVASWLSPCAELLPLPYRDATYTVVNVVITVDALDSARTEWDYDEAGTKLWVTKEVFDPGSVPDLALFRIPEDCGGRLLTATGVGRADAEFKTVVEREGMTGLLFEQIWSDE